ncbi:MAG TPA: BTAD domain-containing putative transcriptional regulator [Gaiellaceae bacterium]|nr:BTAD domain-containing putative transcriptional regulator [Gaiellaceae bacterium]
MEFRLLGAVEAEANGGRLALGGPTQRALLALLLLEPGRPVPADRLAAQLGAEGEATLRSYVSRLRRALGRETVVAAGGGYLLRATPEQVDARRFEHLVRQARADGPGLASERLHAALALWRGPALADVAECDSLAQEALRLEELRLAALEERIEADLALGRHALLVPELQALVAAEPLRERLRRQLVLALYRCGRQADALAAYRDAQRLLDEELGLEPGEELKRLERAILRHEVEALAPAGARHGLPAPTTSFVGRGRELAELADALRGHRLVTLTGIGGSGKTRLALESARRHLDVWADGVRLVDLTALAEPELVEGAVAHALGADELGDVRTRELLLVVDNCEHVVDAAAEVLRRLLGRCEGVRVLATSRVPLGIPGELDYPVEPLESDLAVQLFVERARTFRRDVADDEAELALVGAICRELDGLPLSIELAAARAKALSLREIASRLDDRLRFLRAWQRVADPRHRTLEATMDWSYGLLGADEQRLLRRLAVFAGGWSLDAAAEVCLDGDEEAALELLGRLVDASLVRVEHDEATRYGLLETVRVYAAERLAEDPDADALRRRHAEHYLRVAEATNLAIDARGRGPQRQQLALLEQHNFRAALDYGSENDVELALRLMVGLENFWMTHALREGERRFRELLERAEGIDPHLHACAVREHGSALDVLLQIDEAERLYRAAKDAFAALGDEVATAYMDYRIAIVLRQRDPDDESALRLWRDALEVFRRHGATFQELQVVGDLGYVEIRRGNREEGRRMFEESMRLAAESEWHWWIAQGHAKLAQFELEEGRVDEAEQLARSALSICRQMRNRTFGRLLLAILARTAAARGERERAAAIWSAVAEAEEPAGRWGRFDRETWGALIPEVPGREPLSYPDAVALALS